MATPTAGYVDKPGSRGVYPPGAMYSPMRPGAAAYPGSPYTGSPYPNYYDQSYGARQCERVLQPCHNKVFPHGSCFWQASDKNVDLAVKTNGWKHVISGKETGKPANSERIIDMSGAGISHLPPTLSLPPSFGKITALYLASNNLTQFPMCVCELRNLRTLHLEHNMIATIPPEIASLSELIELDLAHNKITKLPNELGHLWHIISFNILGNSLTYPSPEVLQSCAKRPLLVLQYLRDQIIWNIPKDVSLERQWLAYPPALDIPGIDTKPVLRTMTFNCLSPTLCSTEVYPYAPTWALAWEYRQPRLVDEIKKMNADIVCLQEVDQVHSAAFLGKFEPEFKSLYLPKLPPVHITDDSKIEGCAMLYRTSKVNLLKREEVIYRKICTDKYGKSPRAVSEEQTRSVSRLHSKGNVAILVLFELVNVHPRRLFIVSNTHIHWDPQNTDLKLMQVEMLMEEITSFRNRAKAEYKVSDIPVFCIGDFNTLPTSIVYHLLANSVVPHNHSEWGGACFPPYTERDVQQELKLASSMATVMGTEPDYTNLGNNFTGVLDYIWYTPTSVIPYEVLKPLPFKTLEKFPTPLPNAFFPSDHVSVVVDFAWKN